MKNTLSKQTTIKFYNSADGYDQITNLWKTKIAEGFQPTTYDLLSYAVLRGKDYRKGFSLITNQVKLDNGAYPDLAYRMSSSQLLNRGFPEMFDNYISPCALQVLQEVFPDPNISMWGRKFPKDYAYNEEVECLTSTAL
jgi:hypothetical protein